MSFKIKKGTKNNFEIIKLVGDASRESVYKFSKALEGVREKGKMNIAIDFSETTFIDSSTLGVLIFNRKMVLEQGGDLCLMNLQGYLNEILQNANLDRIFRIVDNEEDL